MRSFNPRTNLRHFSAENASHLARITSALDQVRRARLWPAAAEALRFTAMAGTVHYSTLIEGNRLPLIDAERAAHGELGAVSEAEIELANYVDALNELDRRLEADGLSFTPDLIRAVHFQTTKGLGTPEGPFKPEHEGVWRPGIAVVADPISGQIIHEGAAAGELEPRMRALCAWVELKLDDPINWPPPVIAGVVHYNVVEDHPFADGNGRVARLMSTAVLMRADYVPGRLFNFEAHYGLDKAAYLAALRSVARETWNLETWMRYFLKGLALEYERVAGEVARLSELGAGSRGAAVQLSEAQQRGLSQLQARGLREFDRADYEDAAGVSTTKAQNDLRFLSGQGIVERHGDGRARRYRFPSPGGRNPWAGRGGGRPREWTDERIEAELRDFAAGETDFPRQARFRSAGRGDLYAAIVNHGGPTLWAGRVGLTPPRRGRPPGPGPERPSD